MNAGTVLFDQAATWRTDPTKGAAAGRVAGCNPGAGTSALDEAGNATGGRRGGGKKGDTIKLGTYETTGGDGGMWMVPVSDSAEREGCCKELPSQAQQPRRLRTEDQENIKQRQQQAVGLVGCWAD